MTEQTLILVDEHDRVVGYAPRSECHRGEGILHRAIAVLLYDGGGRALLQNRRSALWDGYWDVTSATHPLHLLDRDESYEEAACRLLRTEWGVEASVEPVLAFTYFERFGESCEREYCLLLAGRYDGEVSMNPEHAHGMRWVGFEQARLDAARTPSVYTPWARLALEKLAEHPFSKRLTAR